jgi:hypothetical protein
MRAAWERVGWIALVVQVPALAACIPGPLSLAPAADDAATDGGPAGDGPAGSDGARGSDAASNGDGDSGSGCTCVAAAPSGWSFVAFEGSSRTSCPTGYGGPTDVLVDPTDLGPPSCGCTCAVATPPTCTQGTLGLIGGNTSNCPVTGNPVSANTGACRTQPLNLPYPYLGVQPPTASGGSCTPTVTATPPPPGGTSGRTCAASPAPPPGTCGASEVCAPDVASPYALCIAQSGAVACPSGYSSKHTTGTSITPGGCGTCTCGTPSAACTSGTFSAYINGSCGGLLLSIPADGQCHSTNAGAASSYIFSVTPTNLACAVAQQPQPTGNGGTLQGVVTVCCP